MLAHVKHGSTNAPFSQDLDDLFSIGFFCWVSWCFSHKQTEPIFEFQKNQILEQFWIFLKKNSNFLNFEKLSKIFGCEFRKTAPSVCVERYWKSNKKNRLKISPPDPEKKGHLYWKMWFLKNASLRDEGAGNTHLLIIKTKKTHLTKISIVYVLMIRISQTWS